MRSTRLPDKVLKDIAGQPMLVHVFARARRAATLSETVIATSEEPADDPIAALCAARGYPYARGSHQDVLDRYYQAARRLHADIIVRLTADCPLIDPDVIDHVVRAFREAKADFAANRLPPPLGRTYPIGLDVEVCTFDALDRAWREADQPYHREHVMPYLYEVEGRVRVLMVNHDPDYGHLRWTVDTPKDLEAVRRIFAHFAPATDFTWKEVLELYARDPSLAAINAEVRHKGFRDSAV